MGGRGLGAEGLPPTWPHLPPSWKFPWEGDREGSPSDSSQLCPRGSREQGQCGEAGGDLAGKERRLCFQSWLSWAALGNILSQLGALCCVVCVFMVLGGGVGRGDSCQSCSSQGLIRGDPSLGLAHTAGHPSIPPTPARSLRFGRERGGQRAPGSRAGQCGRRVGRSAAVPSGHLSDGKGRAWPGQGQSPLGSWAEPRGGPWSDGGEARAIQALWPPGKRVGLCDSQSTIRVECRAECGLGDDEGEVQAGG